MGQLLAAVSAIDWQAVAALAAVAALVGRYVGGKIDAVGEHLERQDHQLDGLAERVSRLEGYERLNRMEGLERLGEMRRERIERDRGDD